MYRFWLLLFCLWQAAFAWSQCRTAEGLHATPVLVQTVKMPQRFLTLDIWVLGKPRTFVVMENLPLNVIDDKLVADCQEQGVCGKTDGSIIPGMQLEEFIFDEQMLASFKVISSSKMWRLLRVRKKNLFGILGRPFMEWFQWAFSANELALYRDCDPLISLPGESHDFLDADYYQLSHGEYPFIGDVLYGHVVEPTPYDRNIRLTVRPDPRLYMTGSLSVGNVKQKTPPLVSIALKWLYLDGSALYGSNELSDLYESHNGVAYKSRISNVVPVVRNVSVVIRASDRPQLPHLEWSLFGLSKELDSEVLFYQENGRGKLRFNDLKPDKLGNLPQSVHQPRGIY